MKSAVITATGQPPVFTESPDPASPNDGQVLVKMHAAALNPFDVDVASGKHPHGVPPTPYVPGCEGVGMVVDGPPDRVGTRVRVHGAGGFGPGILAEYIAVPSECCTPVPDGLDDVTAAAIGIVSITALEVLERAQLRPGNRLLVLGATGAVGRAAVQIAHIRDAGTVIAAGRDPAALARLGADRTVDLRHIGWADNIPDSMDVVIDLLWGPYAPTAVSRLATGGRYMSVGSAAGATAPLDAGVLRRRQATVHGFTMTQLGLATVHDRYEQAAELALSRHLKLPIEVHALPAIADAWQSQCQSRGNKVVVTMTDPVQN